MNSSPEVWYSPLFESLRIDANLVTLSACESGLGKEMGGEGLIGLTRAFLYAGAKSVISTLWQVADMTTAELMKKFYYHSQSNIPINRSLRAAQLEFIHSPLTLHDPDDSNQSTLFNASHPFFWAGFSLNGAYN